MSLIVNPIYRDTVLATICDNETYYFEGINYNKTGIYKVNYETDKGCDSIRILSLNVNPTYNELLIKRIYEDEYYIVGDKKFNKSGTYIIPFKTKSGCDSTVRLDLTIIPYPKEITAFSPYNKDGINDYFMPEFDLKVFNRYGKIIYETKTAEQRKLGWDGTRGDGGKLVEPGMYFYILSKPGGPPRIKSSVEVLKR